MNRSIRLAGTHIVLAAMILRALLPAGWMPNTSHTGGATLVICTLDGPVRMAIGPGGEPHKQAPAHDGDHRHDVCPFAAAAHFAAPVAVATLASPSEAATKIGRFVPAYAAATGPHYSQQSPRAPPSLA